MFGHKARAMLDHCSLAKKYAVLPLTYKKVCVHAGSCYLPLFSYDFCFGFLCFLLSQEHSAFLAVSLTPKVANMCGGSRKERPRSAWDGS